MRSLGSTAYDESGSMIDTFYAKLLPLEGAIEYEGTVRWFKEKEPEAWAELLNNADHPERVMREYFSWVKALPGLPVFIGYPAGFDFSFVRYYLHRFLGPEPDRNPFSHSALDIKTAAMIAMGSTYRDSTKKNMPKYWFSDEFTHDHTALMDSMDQGHLYFSIRAEIEKMREDANNWRKLKQKINPEELGRLLDAI